ncbi:ribosome recycling factor [Mariprofundus ferrooxydans]|uniref:Ribosome-recycling factor n=1 Tax=Mariprofundus ferrooxydans PV-1 TaxID=314345 RepID=Q0EYF6_9PROT|nr:ribosome recycling factor [Mariprofundus ferrooxydans]EAU54236.1 Ribosome recycling factor [Mariprofundus ferrooxydans PV-1]KON47784.1 ribosome recycling factor [Mariprofundus ferrooxydans]
MFDALEERMKKSVVALRSELATIRTGRANAALLDQVTVSYYGSEVPFNQVGNISVPEPRILMITPWEKSIIGDIEKAILKSDLGLNPTSDGEVVRIMLPELTEDRRKELVKKARTIGEKARVSIRNIRRDANDEVKKQAKDDNLPEDESKRLQDRIQKITDKYIAEVDQVIEHKEQDILTV